MKIIKRREEIIASFLSYKPAAAEMGNMEYSGDTIYCYGPHSPLARLLPNGPKNRTLLMAGYRRSKSTHKQQSVLYRLAQASNEFLKKRHPHFRSSIDIVYCNYIPMSSDTEGEFKRKHLDNIKSNMNELERIMARARGAKLKWTRQNAISRYAIIKSQLFKYCDLFNLKRPRIPNIIMDKEIISKIAIAMLKGDSQ